MYKFTPHAIAPFISFVFTLSLAGFVYFKDRHSRLNITLSAFCFFSSVWQFSTAMMFMAQADFLAIFWDRCVYLSVILMFPLAYHFAVVFSEEKRQQNWIRSAYIIAIIYVFLSRTDYFVSGLYRYKWGCHAIARILHHPFVFISTFYYLRSAYLVFRKYKTSSLFLKRQQYKYYFLGYFIYIFAAIGYAPAYKIGIYPFAYWLPAIYALFVTNAIISYHLMDIQVVFSQTLAVILAGIGVLAFHTLFVSLLHPITGYYLASTVSLIAIAYVLFVTPFRKRILAWTDSVVLKGKYDYQQTLKEAARAVVTMLDLDELLEYLIDVISKSLGVERLALLMKDDSQAYSVRWGYGVGEEIMSKYQVKSGLIEWLKQKKEIFVKEVQQIALPTEEFNRIYTGMQKLGAEVSVPLFFKGELEGILTLGRKDKKEPYVQSDIELLEALASQAAIAIKNAQLYEEAITDSLTRLYHHKYFRLRLEEEIERSKRYKHPVSLLMIDLDHFKEINDHYGHQAGDAILKGLADILKASVRRTDIVARYGGEEFSVILPETGPDGAKVVAGRLSQHVQGAILVADRLRKTIEQEEFKTEDGKQIKVTLSVGISCFDGESKDFTSTELIERADNALYRAKENGRNRTEVWEKQEK